MSARRPASRGRRAWFAAAAGPGLALLALALAFTSGCGGGTRWPDPTWPSTAAPRYIAQIGVADDGIARTARLVVEPGGTLLIADQESPARLLRYDRDGFPRGVIVPASADGGYDLAVLARAPDGRFWTTDLGREHLVRFEADGSGRTAFDVPADSALYRSLTDVAVGPDGTVYALDGYDPRVTVFSPDGRALRHWSGGCPEGCGFDRPVSLVVDAEGAIYVADYGLRSVFKFDAAGRPLDRWRGAEISESPYDFYPARLALDASGAVVMYDDRGEALLTLAPRGGIARRVSLRSLAYSVNAERGFVFLPDGDIVVNSAGVGGALRLDATGRLVTLIGHARGRRDGTPVFVQKIITDARHHVFTLEVTNSRVQEFDAAGHFVQAWQAPAYPSTIDLAVDRQGYLYRLRGSNQPLLKTPLDGGPTREIALPPPEDDGRWNALAVDAAGSLYLGTEEGTIHVFDADGQAITHWSLPGLSDGRTFRLEEMVFDPRGRLWVHDGSYGHLLSCTRAGEMLGGFTAPERTSPDTYQPERLAFDPAGDLTLLADSRPGKRILTVDPGGEVLARWDLPGPTGESRCPMSAVGWDSRGRLYVARSGAACGGVSYYLP